MNVPTTAILLFAFAGLSMISGIAWLAVVFIALGAGMLFFYKEAVEVETEDFDENPAQPHPQQQVVVIQEGSKGIADSISEKMIEQMELERTVGLGKKAGEELKKFQKETAKETKALKREIDELKKKK